MKSYFEKIFTIGNLQFQFFVDLRTIYWLPTIKTYKLVGIGFMWLCFIWGVVYLNNEYKEL